MLVAGGVPATMPICLPFSRGSSSVVTSSRPGARLGDQRIGRAVIGIGALNEIVALRKAHDDIAAMRAERHPHEAGRLREVHVVELLLQLLGEQFGELVLESLALLVGERHVARIGADPQHLGIDQLDRQIGAAAVTVSLVVPLRPRDVAADKGGGNREQRNQQATLLTGHVSLAIVSICARPQNAMLLNSGVQQDNSCRDFMWRAAAQSEPMHIEAASW